MNPFVIDPKAMAQSATALWSLGSSTPKTALSSLLHNRACAFQSGDTSTYLVPSIGYKVTDGTPTIHIPQLLVTERDKVESWPLPESLDEAVLERLDQSIEGNAQLLSDQRATLDEINKALSNVIKENPTEVSKKSGPVRTLARKTFGSSERPYHRPSGTIVFGELPKEGSDTKSSSSSKLGSRLKLSWGSNESARGYEQL